MAQRTWRIVMGRVIAEESEVIKRGGAGTRPSVIVPHEMNYLLAPSLVDAAGIRISSVERHGFDSRLLGDHSPD
jgi:hypothetical protein